MKHFKILTTLALGILASSSGMIQVGAAVYNFNVDFATKEVVNFNDYKQSFNANTYNLETQAVFFWIGAYYFDSCPSAFTANVRWAARYRLNGSGGVTTLGTADLPDFTCTTIPTLYIASQAVDIPEDAVLALIDDDTDFVEFTSRIDIPSNAALNNRTLYLESYSIYFDIKYNFNTTYLFNYFLSDQNFRDINLGGFTATFNSTPNHRLRYLYTTAGNDAFYLRNTNTTSIGTTRKKYAVDYNEEFFRGNSIGAGFQSDFLGLADAYLFPSSPTGVSINFRYNYYYLNSANLAQAIVDAPLINFTEETCSGGFLDINVACYVNNAIAYLVNDAPIISDAFTLLNTGIELAAQTFGIIGSFSDDNVFGYLVLVGFGFIAVKWFLKNDE
jgi:hypothetical protein